MNTPHPRIVIAGGSGFMGTHLTRHLLNLGYAITILTRRPAASTGHPLLTHAAWDGQTPGPWIRQLNGARALINLAGRNVNCRYTKRNRDEILYSRLDAVKVLGQALRDCDHPPGVWIHSSTLAIYGDRGDEPLTEDAPAGQTFSPDVARAWELATDNAVLPDMRKVILRISFALGNDGGALPMLTRLARLGLGGSVGHRRQYYSWIHIQDVCNVVQWAIEKPEMAGVYNVTSPQPVRNAQFMKLLRQALGRPWSPPAPRWTIHLGCFLMRTEAELALRSRQGIPARLQAMGFPFAYPTLEQAFEHLLTPVKPSGKPCCTLLISPERTA